MEYRPSRYHKIESPYKRHEDENGNYTMIPGEHTEGYEWVNDASKCDAVEKLHGTNCAITIKNGKIQSVWTRHGQSDMNQAKPFDDDRTCQRIIRAVQNSKHKGYIPEEDGHHYGEVVGKDFHSNMYELDQNLFIPFSWAREHLRYKSWGEYGTEFADIREWFKDGLFSLFYCNRHGVPPKEASVQNGTFVEGIMFTHKHAKNSVDFGTAPNENHFAKIRREMFKGHEDWPGEVLKH